MDQFTFSLKEMSKHVDKMKASWCVQQRAGRIAKPLNGDFGITGNWGGDWLCQGGSVSFDGKYWVAVLTYLWSGDYKGWDEDLYKDELR